MGRRAGYLRSALGRKPTAQKAPSVRHRGVDAAHGLRRQGHERMGGKEFAQARDVLVPAVGNRLRISEAAGRAEKRCVGEEQSGDVFDDPAARAGGDGRLKDPEGGVVGCFRGCRRPALGCDAAGLDRGLGFVRLVDPLRIVVPDHTEKLGRNRHRASALPRLAAGVLSTRHELTISLPLLRMGGLAEDDRLPFGQAGELLRRELESEEFGVDLVDATESRRGERMHGGSRMNELWECAGEGGNDSTLGRRPQDGVERATRWLYTIHEARGGPGMCDGGDW